MFQETCPPAYRLEQFEKFCRREYCEENLLFYLQSASEKLANNPEQYQKIKAEYISEAAPSQVNLPESLRQKIMHSTDTVELEKGRSHIWHLMETDIWPRFKRYRSSMEAISTSKSMARWWTKQELSHMTMARFFSFPYIINDAEARTHALCTSILVIIIVGLFASQHWSAIWLTVYVTYGFWARTLCGSRLDIQAHLVLFVINPLMENLGDRLSTRGHNRRFWFPMEFKAGFPKRVAQCIGAILSALALSLMIVSKSVPAVSYTAMVVAIVCWAMLLAASTLQWAAGYCLACTAVYYLKAQGRCSDQLCERIDDQLACSVAIMQGNVPRKLN